MVAVGLWILLAAAPRVDCGLEPGICYGLAELLGCELGPGLRFCFGIDEVDPPKRPGVYVKVYPPCDTDGSAWAAPRLAAIAAQTGAITSTDYLPCSKSNPRITVEKR